MSTYYSLIKEASIGFVNIGDYLENKNFEGAGAYDNTKNRGGKGKVHPRTGHEGPEGE